MLLIIIRSIYFCACSGAIVGFMQTSASDFLFPNKYLAFFLILALTQVIVLGDVLVKRKQIVVLSAVYFGLLIGFLLSYYLNLILEVVIVSPSQMELVKLLTSLLLPYICVSSLLQTKDDFRFIIPYVEFSRELKGRAVWVLDSSALIDGRISDLIETHVIDAQLVVPKFILLEVQDIADSTDKIRRTRGRRGLEVLSKLQNSPIAEIRVHDTGDGKDSTIPVDQRLVEVAKSLNGLLVTNDFNLNKIAGVQDVDVINLNEVAGALRPRYLPGERIRIKIIKEGETPGQGVGFLDDGTMVVCEQAASLVGTDIDTIVTSVLQSSAGRMIFSRQVHHTDEDDR